MLKRINLLFILLCYSALFAQEKTGILEGVIRSNAELLSDATIQVASTTMYGISNNEGNYKIQKIPYGTYLVKVSFVGYKELHKTIVVNTPINTVNFLLEGEDSLEEVLITGKSKEKTKHDAPIATEAINIRKIQERAMSITTIINQTAGVKVRQTAGIGSDYEVNINGLQGNSIRYFKNGIPTDYLGRAFQLNLIPTTNITGIEIYKGVLPISLGADALGGAVNITTENKYKNHLTTSYEIGAFNTHLGTLNGNYYIPNNKFHFGINAYAIYSNNDFEIDAPIRDYKTQKLKTVKLKRFHDAINAQLVQANFGIHNSRFADIFDIEVSFFNYYKEIQNGYNLENVFGEVTELEKSNMFALSYKKNFLDKLLIDVFFAHTNKNQKVKDVSDNAYDWFGNVINSEQPNTTRGEIRGLKIDQSIDEDISIGRFYGKYKMSNTIDLKLSTTLSSKDKVGTDPYSEPNPRTQIQPITLPSTYTKIVSGIGLGVKLLDKKIHNEFMIKSFSMNAETISLWRYTKSETQSHSSFGIGNALKYVFNKKSFLRFSFENTTRIPRADEYFGDNLFTVPNPSLQPERSNNLNLGAHTNINNNNNNNNNNNLFLDLNFFYRHTDQFIRKMVVGLNLIHKNADTQISKGAELAFSLKLKERFKSKLSITYQDLRVANTSNALQGSRTPNIPYFFANLNMAKQFENPFQLPINIELYTNYSFTEQYLLLPISKRLEPKLFQRDIVSNTLIIPEQNQFDIGLTVKHKKIPLILNFQMNNALNLKLYDQFKIQKPLRNFRTKITYKF